MVCLEWEYPCKPCTEKEVKRFGKIEANQTTQLVKYIVYKIKKNAEIGKMYYLGLTCPLNVQG